MTSIAERTIRCKADEHDNCASIMTALSVIGFIFHLTIVVGTIVVGTIVPGYYHCFIAVRQCEMSSES